MLRAKYKEADVNLFLRIILFDWLMTVPSFLSSDNTLDKEGLATPNMRATHCTLSIFPCL